MYKLKQTQLSLAILSVFATSQVQAETLLPINVTAEEESSVQSSVIETQTLNQTGNPETGAALRQIPGVSAARKGGHGLDPQIRGQKQDQINVFLDGAKIEAGCPNRMDPATSYTEIASYDELEVIHGVKSLEYGAGGTGGTLLFKRNKPTYNPEKSTSGEISLSKSNVMNYDANAEVQAVGQTGYVVLQASKKEANNYTDGNDNIVPSSYNSQQGHLDLGWTPNEHHHLKLSGEKSRTEDALYPGAKMDAPETEGTVLRLQYEGRDLSENIVDVDVSAYQSNVDHVMNNYSLRTPPSPTMLSETPTSTQTQGAKIKLVSFINDTKVEYGVQLETVNQDATLLDIDANKTVNFMWPDATKTTKSVFAQTTTPLSPKSQLITGLRYDDVNSTANKINSAPQVNPTKTTPNALYNATYTNYNNETQANEGNWNGLLRFEQSLNNAMNLYAGVSHTTRSANATERYMSKWGMVPGTSPAVQNSWVGNPNIKPEEHNQLDLGLGQNTAKFNWNASVWYDQVNNYILRDLAVNQHNNGVNSSVTGKTEVYVNINAELYGADFDAEYAISNQITVGGNFSLTQGRNTTDNRNIAMISAPNGGLFANYNQAKWNLGSRFNFALEQTQIDEDYTPESDHGKTPAWSTLDVFGGYEISKMVSVNAGIDNVFNHAFYDHLSYDINDGGTYKFNEPGRNYWAKVSAKF